MRNNSLFKQYYKSLICKLFVLGNSSQGESIILVLYGDNQVIYSCVVDSFSSQNEIIPITVLNDLQLERITDLFWTHPHDDHTDGLLDLINTFSPQSIYIPAELHTLPDDIHSLSATVLKEINGYSNGYDRRSRNRPRISPIGCNYQLYSYKLQVNGFTVPFSIRTIAPCTGIDRRNAIDNRYSSLNDYSIVLNIIIGDFSILLTGDIQNRIIQFVNEELSFDVPTPNILKIPHHGSKDSLEITQLFENEHLIDIAITTAKRSSNLPKTEALQHYSSYSSRVLKIDSDITGNAIWGIDVDIMNATVTPLKCKNFSDYTLDHPKIQS